MPTNLQTPFYVYFAKLTGDKKDNHILILTTISGESMVKDTKHAQLYLSEYTISLQHNIGVIIMNISMSYSVMHKILLNI